MRRNNKFKKSLPFFKVRDDTSLNNGILTAKLISVSTITGSYKDTEIITADIQKNGADVFFQFGKTIDNVPVIQKANIMDTRFECSSRTSKLSGILKKLTQGADIEYNEVKDVIELYNVAFILADGCKNNDVYDHESIQAISKSLFKARKGYEDLVQRKGWPI